MDTNSNKTIEFSHIAKRVHRRTGAHPPQNSWREAGVARLVDRFGNGLGDIFSIDRFGVCTRARLRRVLPARAPVPVLSHSHVMILAITDPLHAYSKKFARMHCTNTVHTAYTEGARGARVAPKCTASVHPPLGSMHGGLWSISTNTYSPRKAGRRRFAEGLLEFEW